MLLALALLLGVVGIIISWPRPEPAPPPRKVAFIKQDIPSYSVITQDMIEEHEVSAVEAKNAPSASEVVGRMTTRNISKGQMVTELSALTPEQVRYVSDLGLEIISFPARFDEVIGGQLKPGHRINVYAYRGERGTAGTFGKPPEVRLIANDIAVVDVRTRAGDASARLAPTVTPGAARGGLFGAVGASDTRQDPGSVVTVAVAPEMAYLLVDTLGAQSFDAWVTLAANRAAQITVTPTVAPPTATVVVATPTIDVRPIQTAVAATATAQAAHAPTAVATGSGSSTGSGSGSGFQPSATPGRIPTTGGEKP